MGHFNLVGIVMFLVAMGIGIALSTLVAGGAEGPGMMVAGPLLVGLDLGYRRHRGLARFDRRGGTFVYLPLWAWGLFWFALGIYDTLAGSA